MTVVQTPVHLIAADKFHLINKFNSAQTYCAKHGSHKIINILSNVHASFIKISVPLLKSV